MKPSKLIRLALHFSKWDWRMITIGSYNYPETLIAIRPRPKKRRKGSWQ